MKSPNLPLWSGFVLALIAFISYPFVMVRYPITRDFPWLNLLLFGIAAVLLVLGLRRSFATGATHGRKVTAVILASLGALICVFFVFMFFVFGRQLPASHTAPQVGQTAPEFRLADTNGNLVSLSELRSTPVAGQPPKGVLLVFYRGYW